MNHEVFISHAPGDKGIADAICRKLESAGLKCWVADRDFSAGEDRTQVTRKAIECSLVIVLVLSKYSHAAPHLEREIAHAFDVRRPIIPLRLGETLPWREVLFYLCNVPWCDAADQPTEDDLAALTARVKALIPVADDTVDASAAQTEKEKVASLSLSNAWFGALIAFGKRTFGILQWVGITTFFCAVVLFLWFVLRQTREWATMTKSHRQSMDRGFSLAPTPLPQPAGDALASKQIPMVPRFGLRQAAEGSPTPWVQGSQDATVTVPAVRSADASSSPQNDMSSGQRAGELASQSRARYVTPVTHRVSQGHHPQFPGTQVKEARRIADLENQRDSLRSQLKETEEKLLANQKNADLVASQRDDLQVRLKESEENTQIAQRRAEKEASELEELRAQLKETENRALAAQKNEELTRTQRDALQIELLQTEAKAEAAQKNADLATRQLDELQSKIGELRDRAQRAETSAGLAASQRDAAEAELKKREEEEALVKEVRLNQHGSDLAVSSGGAPDTQFEEVRRQSAHEDAELVQTLPPNPGQNAKPAPLTQTLDSFVRPTH